MAGPQELRECSRLSLLGSQAPSASSSFFSWPLQVLQASSVLVGNEAEATATGEALD